MRRKGVCGFRRKGAVGVVLAAAALLAVPLSACGEPKRFDLQCRLTQHLTNPKYPDQAFERRVRVDLVAGKWCEKQCDAIKTLGVTSSELVLENHDESTNIDGEVMVHSRWRTAVNRRTGSYESAAFSHTGPGDIVEGADTMATVKGSCSKSPFTGFPKPRF